MQEMACTLMPARRQHRLHLLWPLIDGLIPREPALIHIRDRHHGTPIVVFDRAVDERDRGFLLLDVGRRAGRC